MPVIVLDDTPLIVEEPTFAGLHANDRIATAYAQVMTSLRELYAKRYKNPAPDDDKAVFQELDNEVVMPYSNVIAKLVRIVHDHEGASVEEEEHILRILDDFLAQVPEE